MTRRAPRRSARMPPSLPAAAGCRRPCLPTLAPFALASLTLCDSRLFRPRPAENCSFDLQSSELFGEASSTPHRQSSALTEDVAPSNELVASNTDIAYCRRPSVARPPRAAPSAASASTSLSASAIAVASPSATTAAPAWTASSGLYHGFGSTSSSRLCEKTSEVWCDALSRSSSTFLALRQSWWCLQIARCRQMCAN